MVKAKKKSKKVAKKVKKAAKKKPVKAKKEVYFKVSTKILGETPKEYGFYLSDGRRLKSVFELVDALESMGEDMFKQHVTETKNDFSNWIRDVFKEPNIAREIEKIRSRIETQKALMKKLIEAAKEASRK
jgi:hypothetical protein